MKKLMLLLALVGCGAAEPTPSVVTVESIRLEWTTTGVRLVLPDDVLSRVKHIAGECGAVPMREPGGVAVVLAAGGACDSALPAVYLTLESP